VGPGDRFIVAELGRLHRTPTIAVVTKSDLVDRDRLAQQLMAVSGLQEWAEVVPVSAVDGFQVGLLADLLVRRLPVGPPLYPAGELTDEPEAVLVAELIREAALDGVRDELPHSLAVTVEDMQPRANRPPERPLLDVYATVHVERSSQKAIVIGSGGARLKTVGTTARRQVEALLGTAVYLDLHVKVSKDWQRDPAALRRLGF
jgi:GTP-binding protein Era